MVIPEGILKISILNITLSRFYLQKLTKLVSNLFLFYKIHVFLLYKIHVFLLYKIHVHAC